MEKNEPQINELKMDAETANMVETAEELKGSEFSGGGNRKKGLIMGGRLRDDKL